MGQEVRINGLVHLSINEVYWGYPNFQRDIQAGRTFFQNIWFYKQVPKVPGKPKHSMYGVFTPPGKDRWRNPQ